MLFPNEPSPDVSKVNISLEKAVWFDGRGQKGINSQRIVSVNCQRIVSHYPKGVKEALRICKENLGVTEL